MAESKKTSIGGRIAGGAKRAAKAYAWSLTGDLDGIKNLGKRMKQRREQLKARTYRTETFAEAVSRMKLSDAALAKRAEYLASLAFLYGLIVVVALLFLLVSPWTAHPFNQGLLSIGVIALAMTRFLSARFRVAQIRQRALFGFKEWLKHVVSAKRHPLTETTGKPQ